MVALAVALAPTAAGGATPAKPLRSAPPPEARAPTSAAAGSAVPPPASVAPSRLAPLARETLLAAGAGGWARAELGAVRGVTVGPIESALHPGRGYGSPAWLRTLDEARSMGATWVSLTVFGRVWDLGSAGLDPTFERPHAVYRGEVATAIRQARARGLRVLLVPHLWVESGGWRAELEPGDDARWALWAEHYGRWLLGWAGVARDAEADMLSVGVELRSWVTTSRAPSFAALVRRVRGEYPGLLTYSANWDDAEQTVVWGELDLIGINAFYPLTERPGADVDELARGGARVAETLRTLGRSWEKPVLLTEMGYTTRPDPALKPWEWPDAMKGVTVDQAAQARATVGLLAPLTEVEELCGFFVWRLYADPDDQSQEAEWGFNPRGKLAELSLRDAFATHWAGDGPRPPASSVAKASAERPGLW